MENRRDGIRKAAAALISVLALAGRFAVRAAADGGMPLPENAEVLAERAAREILGEYVPLEKIRTEEHILFTCLNGYAAVDPVRGCVTEYALSPGEVCFPVAEEEDAHGSPDDLKNISEKMS